MIVIVVVIGLFVFPVYKFCFLGASPYEECGGKESACGF